MYESLRSHCLQDYPKYEIIFGVSDRDDPALVLIERLKSDFPHCHIRLLLCPQILGANVKVSNLAQMVPIAKYDHRSEEHTSELQSRGHLVCRLLLEKKNTK